MKKSICLMLIMAMFVGLCAPAYAAEATDNCAKDNTGVLFGTATYDDEDELPLVPSITYTTVTCRFVVTIPANTKLQCYTAPDGLTVAHELDAQKEAYPLTCTQKANLSNGTVRYLFTTEDGKALYFVYSSAMAVETIHAYEAVVTEPTCVSQGYTTKTCPCGHSVKDSYVPTSVHSYLGDKCTVCGAAKPQVTGVSRTYGADRYQTAFQAADQLKVQLDVEKFNTIVVASGTEFADALSGSYLAAVKNAPMLLVRSNKNTLALVKDYIKANLAAGGTVYLLGGEKAVPKAMESGLEGYTVKRLGGNTRYETNLMILQEAGVGDKDILICTGKDFADSLSASAAKLPILLVKDSLNDAQKAFLKGATGKKYIIGGANAVSTRVENQVKTYGEVERLGGNTRYDTSVLVAKEFFSNPEAVVVAYAQNFPDGLSGGALACSIDAPLILTANGKHTAAANYTKEQGIVAGFVLGGSGLISDKTVKQIFP